MEALLFVCLIAAVVSWRHLRRQIEEMEVRIGALERAGGQRAVQSAVPPAPLTPATPPPLRVTPPVVHQSPPATPPPLRVTPPVVHQPPPATPPPFPVT